MHHWCWSFVATRTDIHDCIKRSAYDMPMLVQKAGGGIALNHSQTGTGRRWVVSTTLRPLYPRERPSAHFKAQKYMFLRQWMWEPGNARPRSLVNVSTIRRSILPPSFEVVSRRLLRWFVPFFQNTECHIQNTVCRLRDTYVYRVIEKDGRDLKPL